MSFLKQIGRWIAEAVEGTAYYLSSMALFNLIYALRIFGFNWGDGKTISIYNMVAFILAAALVAFGGIYTIIICAKDHTIKNKNTLGKKVWVKSCEDITGDNFFSKYSILVLTGNSLPMLHNFIGLAIYLIVLLTLGFVFISQEMYYMNPITALLRYNVMKVKCDDRGQLVSYYFIYKKGSIEPEQELSFLNVSNRIIRLKEVVNG